MPVLPVGSSGGDTRAYLNPRAYADPHGYACLPGGYAGAVSQAQAVAASHGPGPVL